jgi:hypothetical protein
LRYWLLGAKQIRQPRRWQVLQDRKDNPDSREIRELLDSKARPARPEIPAKRATRGKLATAAEWGKPDSREIRAGRANLRRALQASITTQILTMDE